MSHGSSIPAPRPALVVGASGLLGAYLARSFAQVGPVVRTAFEQAGGKLLPLDLREPGAAQALVDEHMPAVVVCASAVSNVERCELDSEGSREVNVDGTLELARVARAAGATFVFLSSEYVFDGVDGPYDESREVRPLNEYGRQKVAVEQALPAMTGGDCIVARVSCLYGHERRGKNFVYQLWAALSEEREFPAPSDQVGTPTAVANAADVIRDLAGRGARGLFHVAGPERMVRSDFALLAARLLGLDPALVRPTPTAELGLVAARPAGAGLLTDRARLASGRGLWGVAQGIDAMVAEHPIRMPASGAV